MKTIDDAKIPHGELELPRGYLHEYEEGKFKRYYIAKFREVSGIEEDILAEQELSWLERYNRIIGSCLVSLKDEDGVELQDVDFKTISNHFLIGDNLVSVLALRRITNGDKYDFEDQCSVCELKQKKVVDLSDFEMVPVEGDPLENVRSIILRDGRELVWEMLNGRKQMEWIDQNKPKPVTQKGRKKKLKIKRSLEGKRKATKAIMSRVISIGGEEPTLDMLRILGSPERQKIRNQFDDEGGIDVEFEVHCTSATCSHSWIKEVDITSPNFFFPSAM
jgi:hypothetical protein